MLRLKPIAVVVLAGAALGAGAAHPIVARDPEPPPSRGEAYDCDSRPTVLNAFWTTCEPRAREQRTAVRVKG